MRLEAVDFLKEHKKDLEIILVRQYMGMLEPEFLIHLEKMLLPLVYGGYLEMIGIAFSQNRQL